MRVELLMENNLPLALELVESANGIAIRDLSTLAERVRQRRRDYLEACDALRSFLRARGFDTTDHAVVRVEVQVDGDATRGTPVS